MTIRFKLALLLLIAAVSPVAISGVFSLNIGRRALEQSVLQLQQQQAEATAEVVESLIHDSWHALISAEKYLEFSDLDHRQKAGALRLVYRQFDRFNLVALFDENGHSITAPIYSENPQSVADLHGHEPVKTLDLQRYRLNVPLDAALASGRAVGSLYFSADLLPRIVLALRIEKVTAPPAAPGVLTAELSLTSIQERLRSIPGDAASAFLLAGDSTVLIAGPEGIEAGTPLGTLGQLASSTSGAGQVELADGEFVVGHAPLRGIGLDWHVLVRQPRDVAFAAVNTMRGQIIFWTVISLVIAAIIAVFFGQSLVKPIVVLVESARSLANGTFSRIAVPSRDEIGQLSATFNDMAITIQQRDTEIRNWNAELQGRVDAKTKELNQAQDQLLESRKLAAVANLGAGAAHEINNPLFVVQGMSEIMLMEVADHPTAVELAQTILDESKRIGKIVEQLHSLATPAGRSGHARIDLNRLLDEALALESSALDSSQIRVDRQLTEPLPPIGGDRVQLSQVIGQLLDNARQAMPSGGVLSAKTSVIDRGAIRVVMSDTGVGIPQDKLERIFEPFFTTKSNWSGTGMGLAVARKVVEDHAGSIRIESEKNRGTDVALTFPVLPGRAHLA